MANDNPVTTIYLRELLNSIQSEISALAGTFNQDGVKMMAGQPGDRLSMEEFTNSTADSLNTVGDLTLTDFASTAKTLTLSGYQKAYAISDQELRNTYHDIMTGSKMGAGISIYEAIENAIKDFMNLNVRWTAGTVGAAIDSFDDVTAATAVLTDKKAPEIGRWAALGSTAYYKIAGVTSQVGADVQGNNRVMQTGLLGNQVGLGFIPATYASQTLTNGTFGAGPFSVKTTAAAGATSVTIDGITASQTGAIIAGTIIEITSGGVAYNYVVQAAANSNSAGEATLTITPALEVQATASDVVTIKTGSSAASYTKHYVYQREFATIGSRIVAEGGGYSARRTKFGWILTTKFDKNTQTWGRNNIGAAGLFGIVRRYDDYAVCLLS